MTGATVRANSADRLTTEVCTLIVPTHLLKTEDAVPTQYKRAHGVCTHKCLPRALETHPEKKARSAETCTQTPKAGARKNLPGWRPATDQRQTLARGRTKTLETCVRLHTRNTRTKVRRTATET